MAAIPPPNHLTPAVRDSDTPSDTRAPKALAPADCITVARLHQRGHSYAAIAKALNATPEQCKRAMTDATTLLQASAGRFAADWIRAAAVAADDGDHKPARDALAAIGVIQPHATPTGPSVTVHVGFAFAGLPPTSVTASPQPTTFDVPALPARTVTTE